MIRFLFALTVFAVLGRSRPISAQSARAPSARGAGLDLMLGAQTTRGGAIENRQGLLVDATIAITARESGARALVIAGGGGGVLGGNGDTCLILPNGGCAAKGNFGIVHAGVGPAQRVGNATVRALLGPAHVSGGGHSSFGMQARLDAQANAVEHFGLAAMARVTILPSHGGETLTMWALGLGVAFR